MKIRYKVIKAFKDLEDNGHIYYEGQEYPREGKQVPDGRINDLLSKNNKRKIPLIESTDIQLKDLSVAQLKSIAKEQNIEGSDKLKKQELIDAIRGDK